MRRAQTTIETMVSIGVVLTFILLLYSFVLYPRIQQTNYVQTYYSAKSVCDDVSTAINSVAFSGNGFSKKVLLPKTLFGISYEVTLTEKLVNVVWEKGAVYCQYRAKNVSYNGQLPPFKLPPADYLLNNSYGVVKIA